MYGSLRFLYENFVTADMITVSSMLPGWVSAVKKVGIGSALLTATGAYTGLSNKLFFVQVDDIILGKEIGEATFRYRTNETPAGGWEATGILTSASDTLLEDDVNIQFTAGVGNDFELNDYWEFRAVAGWSPQRMLDLKRSTGFKSDNETSLTITIDLGSPQNVTAAFLYDHNLTNSATVFLKANVVDSWVSPAYSQALTAIELLPIGEYLNETYRYWQFDIADPTNSDGYILIGGLYLGNYLELNSCNGDWGSTEDFNQLITKQESPSGVVAESIYTERRVYTLNFGTFSNVDYDDLKGVFQAVRNPLTRAALPLYIHIFSDELEYFMLARLPETLPRTFTSFKNNQSAITLTEEVKTTQKL